MTRRARRRLREAFRRFLGLRLTADDLGALAATLDCYRDLR